MYREFIVACMESRVADGSNPDDEVDDEVDDGMCIGGGALGCVIGKLKAKISSLRALEPIV